MPITIYDFRDDVRNLDVTPSVRSRFLRFEPGQVATRHSHDLGHEVFLILAGQAEFEIEGERAILGPGQYCFARANELHSVRTVGDEPMTMYLSVTPHVEPTHTFWDDAGNRLPARYGGATAPERAQHDPTAGISTLELARRHAAALASFAAVAHIATTAQQEFAADLERSLNSDDSGAARVAIDGIAEQIRRTYQGLESQLAIWNDLAARFAE